MPDKDNDTWEHWSKLVISEIKRLNANQKDIEEKTDSNTNEIAKLRVLSMVYGGVAGTVAALLVKEVVSRF